MAKIDKPLRYDANQLIGIYCLKRTVSDEHIEQLIKVITPLDENEIALLDKKRRDLDQFGNYWDDSALKMNFIAPILNHVSFYQKDIVDIFYNRSFHWLVNTKKETVICDFFIAKSFGIYAPQAPFHFFLQTYKKQIQNEDAEGQMLLSMLIAQKENNNRKPIYGCNIQKQSWIFTTLHDKNYSVSRSYNATQTSDLYKIIFILRALKQVILTELS
jgi:hypothetical protein